MCMPQNFCVSKGGELSFLLGILVRKVNHLQTKAALYPQLLKDPVIVVCSLLFADQGLYDWANKAAI